MRDSWPTWPPDVSSPAGTLRKLEVVPIWLLASVAVFQTYDYFSPSVSFFQIADGFRDLIQFVSPVDHRGYLSGGHEFVHDGQVLFARSGQQPDQLLAPEPRQHARLDGAHHGTDHPPTGLSSGHD